MAWGKLLADKEFPRINGVKINAIYGRMETAHRTDQILSDAYDRKPDYYLLCTDDKKWEDGKMVSIPDIKTRELPKEIASLFGPQVINDEKIYVTRMYIRKSCSGNGSFIDQTFDFSGGCGATSKTICYYRLKRWDNAYHLAVFEGEELGKKYESIISNRSYEVEALPHDFDYEYPCCYIRTEGGLNYPDTKLKGWRRPYKMPYVRNQYDKNHIRVFMEELNMHVFLEKAEPQKGDTGLVLVQTNSNYDEDSEYFCNVVTWADRKKEAPGEIIRYDILKVKKEPSGNIVTAAAMIDDKVQYKNDKWASSFYKINRIKNNE